MKTSVTTTHDALVDIDFDDLYLDAEEKKKPKKGKHKERVNDTTSQGKDDVNADLDAADLFGAGGGGGDETTQSTSDQSAQGRTAKPCDSWEVVEENATTIAQGLSQWTIDEWIAWFDQEHFVSFHGQSFVVYHEIFIDERASLAKYSDTGFKKFHAEKVVLDPTPRDTPKYIEVAPVWLKKTYRRYEQLVFDPSGNHAARHYNMWRGFGVDPETHDTDKIKLITEKLIFENVCNGDRDAAEYVLNWLAHGVQNPAIKPGVAVVLRGAQGTGKGTLGRLMLKIWGGHGVTVSHSKHLTGNFNDHLRTAVFVFSDEAQFVGDSQGNQVLKALITEAFGIFESKGVDADLRKNYLRVLMATNSDWAINAGPDARRFFVLDVSDKMRVDPANPENFAFWDKLNAYINDTGAAEFLDFLLKRDLTGFVPAVFPNTQALARQRALSLPPIHAFIRHCLETGEISGMTWGDDGLSIAIGELNDALVKYCNDHRLRTQELTAPKFGAELKKLGVDKMRRRGVGTQRSNHYVFPPRIEFAKTFVAALGLPADDLLDSDEIPGDNTSSEGSDMRKERTSESMPPAIVDVDLSDVDFD